MSNGYVIHVGRYAPERVEIAFPDKDGRPKPDTVIEAFRQNGTTLIMNRARVWARRVTEKGSPTNESGQVLEVTDKAYSGKLEFMDWGKDAVGAQAIEIRFLPTSRSLDYDYQRTVQKLETTIEQGLDQLSLRAGENKFDDKKEALLVQMYKVHPQNRDSKSKNPDPSIKGYTYFEVSEKETDKSFVKTKEAALTAGKFVVDISSKPQQLRNLLEIFTGYGMDFGSVNYLSNDTDIYSALLRFADMPGEFGLQVNRYKEEVTTLFEKSKSYKALDLTKNGFIAFTFSNKTQVVFENVEGKGEAMIDWVLSNFIDDYVYKQTQYFKSLCEKLT